MLILKVNLYKISNIITKAIFDTENPSYEPINVTETQMSILGVAVGVVKNPYNSPIIK
ncbi:hypothetical protein [Clostridium psychrophilum]|uniref:hypothetical protein n=1 Tax=Clostridium psychrophilum TaxID=132926 RepID=UPI001C0B3656|nr:hypothetical protein [Clostridium psychrophilum]MBU3182796.1 hypothetical protein [Clostridium psychrophilum]